ncbi:MAG: class I SAM-dependent methyltransferase [Chloroflexi bacterium]|nr:MAG: class I SAM-dependent methyltransferase [Chloroflexota bacterium]
MNRSANNQLRTEWEARANTQGSSLSGVLLRNLSPALNLYIHNWHVHLIKTQLLTHLPAGGKLLDVACGYGRLSKPVLAFDPTMQLYGLDFANAYCQQYRTDLQAPAICASINHLPLANAWLDGLVAVTALMYVPDNQAKTVLQQLMQRLKPGGYALFIDPGAEFLNLVSRMGGSGSSTSGTSFYKKEYLDLADTEGVEVVAAGGLPLFTLLLPLMHGLGGMETAVKTILKSIVKADRKLEKVHKFTLHRWMLLRRTV